MLVITAISTKISRYAFIDQESNLKLQKYKSIYSDNITKHYIKEIQSGVIYKSLV